MEENELPEELIEPEPELEPEPEPQPEPETFYYDTESTTTIDLSYIEMLLETTINRIEIMILFNIFLMILVIYSMTRSFRK